MLVKKTTTKTDVSRVITTAHGDFTINLRRPTYAELLAASSMLAEAENAYRYEVSVIGWSDLCDESGVAIPFSLDALKELCGQYPSVFRQVWHEVMKLWFEIESDQKKSPEPPNNGGETLRAVLSYGMGILPYTFDSDN